MVAADDIIAVTFSLFAYQAGDIPEGKNVLKTLNNCGWEGAEILMDKARKRDETRQPVSDLGMASVVPPSLDLSETHFFISTKVAAQ